MKNAKKEFLTTNLKVNDNLEFLKKRFPECFDKNKKFDFNKLKNILLRDESIRFTKESYSLEWLTKKYAHILSSEPTQTLLKEDEEWNKKSNNKNSNNLLIKGDNLDVLKHLSNAYGGMVDVIYIDPPYNTGKDGFIYEDNRNFDKDKFMDLSGLDEETTKRILEFVDSKSNTHSAWLTFMYPRLYIAKNFLTKEGMIFISIDDNEFAQLKIICDEIFGEDNFVSNLVWEKSYSPKNNSNLFSSRHEYVLVYSRNKSSLERLGLKGLEKTEKQLIKYKYDDDDGRGVYQSDNLVGYGGNFYKYPGALDGVPQCPPNGWGCTIEKMKELDKDNRIFQPKLGGRIRLKRYLNETQEGITPETILFCCGYDKVSKNKYISRKMVGSTQEGTKEVDNIMGGRVIDFPKPLSLIKFLINYHKKKDAIVLDFFAGSGTTAHAVMELNKEDNGKREFLLVQIPEKIDKNKDKKNEAIHNFLVKELKISEPTIFDITRERIARADKELKMKAGMKVFETTQINEKFLSHEDYLSEKNITNHFFTLEELMAVLTTWKTHDGVPLTQNPIKINLNGYDSYLVGDKIYLMHESFSLDNLKSLFMQIDDKDSNLSINHIYIFGYNFGSTEMREIQENVLSYNNKKSSDIQVVIRY